MAAAGLPQQLGEAGVAAVEGWDNGMLMDDLGTTWGRPGWLQLSVVAPNNPLVAESGWSFGFWWIGTSNGLTALCLVNWQVNGRPSVQDW